ncbi:MAG: DUF4430 domain-containing protein [Pseudobutyrivibrio sp.]|nr:DUF4430 domain-containing protein [Pseudobutyrivibrio sp.]
MEKKNTKKIIIAAVILAALIAIFSVCYFKFVAKPTAGEKSITIEVVADDGQPKDYKLDTDAEFLIDAMDELADEDSSFSFEGSDGQYGMMIEVINGKQAIYEKDNAYWALYVNDNYGEYGVDQQPVQDGDTYTWKYENAPE